jgi:hypothetical protein
MEFGCRRDTCGPSDETRFPVLNPSEQHPGIAVRGQQAQQTGVLFIITQQVQPAFIIDAMQSQHA